jgi:hypothetical protein
MRTSILLLCAMSTLLFSQNPCDDPRYVALKKKNIDSMSQREFEYFMLKEKYCIDDAAGRSGGKSLCTLSVIIDSAIVDGKAKEFNVFVDDVELTVRGQTVVCPVSSGIHKVSLFSLEEIDDFEKKINRRILTNDSKTHFFGIGVMEVRLRQMKNTVKTISAIAGKRMTMHYRFTCDTGKTGKCTDDSWVFTPEVN